MLVNSLTYTVLFTLGLFTGWALSSYRTTFVAWLYRTLESVFITTIFLLTGILIAYYFSKDNIQNSQPKVNHIKLHLNASPINRRRLSRFNIVNSTQPEANNNNSKTQLSTNRVNPDSLDISGVFVVSPETESVFEAPKSQALMPVMVTATHRPTPESQPPLNINLKLNTLSTSDKQDNHTKESSYKPYGLAPYLNPLTKALDTTTTTTTTTKSPRKRKNVLFALNLTPKKSPKKVTKLISQNYDNARSNAGIINYTLQKPPVPPKKTLTVLERAEGEYAFRVKQPL